ncbi:MAG: ABC transporter ATP-binding protein [Cyanobacteria bacterium P01_C01_bin.72]
MQASRKIINKLKITVRFIPALRLVWQSSPGWTIARLVLVVFQGLLPLAMIYLAKLIIDTVTLNLRSAEPSEVFAQVLPLVIMAGAATILNSLSQSLTDLVNTAHSQKVTDYMQGIIHAKSVEADLEYYENAKYHDALQRAQQEAPYRPPQILNRLAQVGQNSISLLAMVGLLVSLHWGIIGILLVASLPAVFVRTKFSKILYSWQRRRTQLERQSVYLGWMLTNEQFAKEVRLFDLGGWFSQEYRQIRHQLYKEKLSISSKRTLAFFLSQAFAGALVFSVFGYIIYQTIEGALLLGDLVLYYQALQRGQNNLRLTLNNFSGLYEDNLFLANLYEFLDLKPRVIDPDQPKPMPPKIKQGIEFKHVNFSYADSAREALKDINLTIKPGETIALVGENGSGKTTLIKLLCRLYDPTSGSISVDGVDLKLFSIADLRRQVSVIFQDYAKYHFSAEENIRLGDIDVPPRDKEIYQAAMKSGAHDVVTKLPQGYDTVLGKLFDSGEELSIGQWQKVALARAFLRDSQVIVLDEPTSAMDPKAEYEIFKKFRELIKDQSAVLITHRLSTVKMADRIYVMDGGKIIESGTHDELMQLQQSYARLFETQAQNYRT